MRIRHGLAFGWIWTIRGHLSVPAGHEAVDAIQRIALVLAEHGAKLRQSGAMLDFRKEDAGTQDPLASFDHGTLSIQDSQEGLLLRYDLTSRALGACFAAPPIFMLISATVDRYQTTDQVFAILFAGLYLAGRVSERAKAVALFSRSLEGRKVSA